MSSYQGNKATCLPRLKFRLTSSKCVLRQSLASNPSTAYNLRRRAVTALIGARAEKMSEEPTSYNRPTTYDPLYLLGIKLFNEYEFFEAHETWEELWTEYRGEGRKFYQGLIQVAVAMQHFTNGNLRGAKKVYATSRNYLQAYPAVYEGLDLETFLAQYQRCFQAMLQSEAESPTEPPQPKPEIDPELIPEIRLI